MTVFLAILTLLVGIGGIADASPGITYHGRLLKPNGQAVSAAAVQFRIQIRTPLPSNCLLYEEIHTKDLSSSAGTFSVTINDGTATTLNTEPYTLDRVFQNRGTFNFPTGKCAGSDTDFTPNSTDGRVLYVSFNDGSFSDWEPLPSQAINFVPTALESVTVGGHKPSNFFRVVDSGTLQTLAPWSTANYQKLVDLVANTTISGGNASIGGNAAGFTGSLTGDVTGGQSSTRVEKIQGHDVASGLPTAGQVLTWNNATSRWEPATPSSTATPTGSASGDLSGNYPGPVIATNAVTTTKISDGAITTTKLQAGSADGQIFRFDGSAWQIAKLNYRDLTNNLSGSPWPLSSCTAGQAVVWLSASDAFACQSIAIDSSNIVDGSINTVDLADGAVTTPKIQDNAVTNQKIQGVSVDKITSGPGLYLTYDPNNIACSNGDVLKKTANGWECGADNNAGGTVTNVSGTSPISVATGTTTPVISLNAAGVTNSYLADDAVTSSKILDGTILNADIADGTITATKLATSLTDGLWSSGGGNVYRSTGNVGIGTATPGDRLDVAGRIRATHICAADGTNCKDLTTDWTAGTVTSVTGTAPISVTGTATPVVSLNAAGVTNAHLADDAVTSAKILDGTIATADLANLAVTDAKIAGVAVNKIASGTGQYFTYAPNNNACTAGQVLKKTANGWECGTDNDTTVSSGTVAGQVLRWSGSAWAPSTDASALTNLNASELATGTMPVARMPALTGGDVTSSSGSGVLTLTNSGVTAGTYTKVQVDAKGRVIDALPLVAGDIPNLDWSKITTGKPTTLSGYGITDAVQNAGATPSLQSGLNSAKPTAGTAGRVYISTDTQEIYRDTGSAWVAIGKGVVTSGTVTNVATGSGLTGGPITSTGTISIATGGVSNTHLADDSVTSAKILDGTIATADLANLAVTDAKISGVAVNKITSGASQYFTYAPNNNACTAGQILKWNNSRWECGADNNAGGTVTSVGVTVPGYMTSSGGPITSSGNIALGFGSQAQNMVFASPVAASGAPSFRNLQISDIRSAMTGAFLTGTTCTASQALKYDVSTDTMSCQTVSGVTPSGSAGGDLTGTYPNPTIAANAVTTAKIIDGAVTSAKILDGTIVAADIANGTITDVKIAGVAVNKITSSTGQYFTYAPNGNACTAGQILKWNSSRWECGADNNAGGTVTSITAGTGLTGGTITTTGTIGLGTELTGLNALSTTGFVKRTGAGAYSTSAQVNLTSEVTGVLPIANGGTGANSATAALTNLLPSQSSQSGKVLGTNGTAASWVAVTNGTVTSVSATAPLTVTNGTTTPAIAITNGTVTGQMLRWSGTAWQASVDGSALTTLNATNLSSGSIPAARIAAGTITSSHIADGTIADADIANGTITASKLVAAVANGLWTVSGSNINRPSGNVGIGVASPAQKLEVLGNVKATAFISTSDRRLKRNIATVDGIEKVRQLRGVEFDWRANGEHEIGLIAQEVEAVYPDLVVTDPNTGYKAVKYSSLVSPLIEATKDLYGMCKAHDDQIKRLQAENAALKAKNQELESRLEAIERRLGMSK